ncbi:TetR/AcrR family transcriptional regulator [Kitasatospora sp. NPDC056531]|uniref:TetR/AcrR family transcriptional regulator n=1 Tax=Kitasatospora sp. NPDC056531 TaxID=3345856 RepID=UPI0036C8C361
MRMTADLRRASVLRAAVREFSRRGLYGTSTDVIARSAGVSQPYLFRLFPGKKAIFLAASRYCFERISEAFETAARDLAGEAAMHAMWRAWEELIEEPELPMMQSQVCAAACGDREIALQAAAGWQRVWEIVDKGTGLPRPAVARFFSHMAHGSLLVSLELPDDLAHPAGPDRGRRRTTPSSPALHRAPALHPAGDSGPPNTGTLVAGRLLQLDCLPTQLTQQLGSDSCLVGEVRPWPAPPSLTDNTNTET